jgi:hypothetical protein
MSIKANDQSGKPAASPLSTEEAETCEHYFDPDEGYTCLSCGKDGTEDVLSAAYDRAKDIRKYGH